MHRIQVQLTAEQERMLRELAHVRGSSISALIREGVDAILAGQSAERQHRIERALAYLGSLPSAEPGEPTDVAENHDEYFVQAIEGNLGLREPIR